MDHFAFGRLIDVLESIDDSLKKINESLESLEIMQRCNYFCDRTPTLEHDTSCFFSPDQHTN